MPMVMMPSRDSRARRACRTSDGILLQPCFNSLSIARRISYDALDRALVRSSNTHTELPHERTLRSLSPHSPDGQSLGFYRPISSHREDLTETSIDRHPENGLPRVPTVVHVGPRTTRDSELTLGSQLHTRARCLDVDRIPRDMQYCPYSGPIYYYNRLAMKIVHILIDC